MNKIGGTGSLSLETTFVAITDIFPTRVATVPWTSEKMTITSKATVGDTEHVGNKSSKLKYLLLIPLHPDKLALRHSKRPFKALQLI